MDQPPSSKPASPSPIPRGRPLVRRGLLALAVGVLGCADKSGAAQPEGASTAVAEPPMPYRPADTAAPIVPSDAPKSPFLIAPGQGASAPVPTPAPLSPPLDAGSPPVPDAGIRVVPPHPPPHPITNAPHPPPHPVGPMPPHPGPPPHPVEAMPPHPAPPRPLQVAE